MIEKLFSLFNYKNAEAASLLRLKNITLNKEILELFASIEADKPIDVSMMNDLLNVFEGKPIQGAKSFDYAFNFLSYDENDVVNYYKFIVKRISQDNSNLVSAVLYTIYYRDEVLTIEIPEEDISFLSFKGAIIEQFNKLGFSNIEINFQIIERAMEDVSEIIRKEKTAVINDAMKLLQKDNDYVQLKPERELTGKQISLSKLPQNEEEFYNFKESESSWSFIIQGIVVFYDKDALDKRGSVKFIIHDGESYVYCTTRRLSTKEEQKYYNHIDVGMHVIVQAYPELNKFSGDASMHIVNIKYSKEKKKITNREDNEPIKRVELHAHSKMSGLDGVPEMKEYLEAAKIFGMNAFAITDHASVQSFHDLQEFASKNKDFKPIFGVELDYVDQNDIEIAYNSQEIDLDEATFTVFDLETTGFSVNYERIIEVSAVKIHKGVNVGEFSELVNPEKPIPPSVVALTGISNNDIKNAPSRLEVLSRFKKFIDGTILVAHNADFDISQLNKNLDDLGIDHPDYPVIDTLMLAKALIPGRRSYGLDALTKYYKVRLDTHHRALADATATMEIFLHMIEESKQKGVKYHSDLNKILLDRSISFTYPIPKHINLIAATQQGIINLYHLLSIASTDYCAREPILTREVLDKYREGILVGSGCRNSYFFDTAFRKTDDDMEKIIDMYDYIEVQPFNTFDYMKHHYDNHVYCYQDTIKRIIMMAKKHNKLVVATGDCHQVNKEDTIYRDILVNTEKVGGGWHYLHYEKEIPSEYFMTTREMLDQFSFLGDDLAYEIVVKNTNLVSDMIDNVKAFTNTPYPPADNFMSEYGIESAEEYVNNHCYEKAKELYGELLPGMVKDRIDKELENINENKFSTIYLISQRLVYKSRSDGYVVGSRGSVGSSFVAHLLDITEVNSLPPHYRCPHCHFSSFKMLPDEKKKYGVRNDEEELQPLLEDVLTGFDLKDMNCPVCGTLLERDGQDIPFETFLGVPEDPKTPDIDLNFSGENQGAIHNYIRDVFGQSKAFRAGTILTCKDKTSYAIVKDYFEFNNDRRMKAGLDIENHTKAEVEALSNQITGSKRSSSQHPGGIVVVPSDHEIYEVTPVQYPGDSKDRSWMTTHFDYHSFEKNLFKLDVLGHDDPTVIRYLMKYVKKYPELFPFDDALNIPVNDHNLFMLMNNTKIINCLPQDICSNVATYGVSEFGTPFVRGLLEKAKPTTFAELIKVSGLSHGTDVWNDNAEALISGTAKDMGRPLPKIDFKDIIGCRDDIMTDLISFGVPAPLAFKIMEFVRKGKPSKDEVQWDAFVEELHKYPKVPQWYIWSCSRIKYMFPKAHATAYVVMALRIAWFKLYQPIFFYSAILSKKMTAWDVEVMVNGTAAIRNELDELKSKPQNERKAKEDDLITTLELALEMTVRGMKFRNVNLYESEAEDFKVSDDKQSLYIPFAAIDGLGGEVAKSIITARNEKPFTTKSDFKARTRVSSTLFQRLEELGVFGDMPEDNQISLDLGI